MGILPKFPSFPNSCFFGYCENRIWDISRYAHSDKVYRYIDASCRPMGLTDSLYDYVRQSNNTALNPEHLYRCARLWGLCFWGKRYPDQEMLDDIENYRALELLHASFDMRFRTWRVLVDSGPGTESVKSLFRDIITTRDVRAYHGLFDWLLYTDSLARNTPTFSSLPNSLALYLLGERSAQFTWPCARFTPRSFSIAGCSAWVAYHQLSTGKPWLASRILPRSSLRLIRGCCAACIGLYSWPSLKLTTLTTGFGYGNVYWSCVTPIWNTYGQMKWLTRSWPSRM